MSRHLQGEPLSAQQPKSDDDLAPHVGMGAILISSFFFFFSFSIGAFLIAAKVAAKVDATD